MTVAFNRHLVPQINPLVQCDIGQQRNGASFCHIRRVKCRVLIGIAFIKFSVSHSSIRSSHLEVIALRFRFFVRSRFGCENREHATGAKERKNQKPRDCFFEHFYFSSVFLISRRNSAMDCHSAQSVSYSIPFVINYNIFRVLCKVQKRASLPLNRAKTIFFCFSLFFFAFLSDQKIIWCFPLDFSPASCHNIDSHFAGFCKRKGVPP